MTLKEIRDTLIFAAGYMAIILLSMFVLSSFSHAQVQLGSATVSYTPPTQNSDGTPLTDLAGYRIYYGTSPDSYTQVIEIDDPSVTVYVVDNLAPATYYFVSTAVNSSGIESEFSNVATKTIAGVRPAPPDGLTVDGGTVFTVVKQEDRFVLLPVGSIGLGTDCDEEQSVNGHYVVPRSQVQWSGNIQPLVVVAACS